MTGNRKTRRRYNQPGDAHALTFSCFQGRPFLSRDRSRQWMVDAIALSREQHAFDLWAFVIMPEHAHLLIWPRECEYEISNIITTIKQSVTRRALQFVRENAPEYLIQMLDQQPNGKRCYRFWQRGGGYDRNVCEVLTARREIDYIHANPVRRGLCQRPEEWYWSSAREYVTGGPTILKTDRKSWPWP